MKINTTDLITILSYIAYMIWPIKNLANGLPLVFLYLNSKRRIESILSLQEERIDGDKIDNINSIKLIGNFSYNNDKEVLKNINVEFNKGKKIALVGRSGSGKSTIIKLILGKFFMDKGSVYFDDISINQLSLDSIRNMIGYVPQKPMLIDSTLKDNLLLFNPNITDIAEVYINAFNQYDKDYLTKTEDHLEASKEKETNLADFYTDFLRHISGADIALLNGGSFRTPFYRGNITNATVHSFDPFGNDLVKFKAKGSEIIKMLKQLQAGNKGFYPSAGLRMTVREKPTRKLLSVKLWDGYKEEEIVEDKLYTIASNDFCFPLEDNEVGGDDFEKVYQWFRPREGKYITIDGSAVSRDILINYLRNIDQLKGNKYYDKDNLRWRVIKTD